MPGDTQPRAVLPVTLQQLADIAACCMERGWTVEQFLAVAIEDQLVR